MTTPDDGWSAPGTPPPGGGPGPPPGQQPGFGPYPGYDPATPGVGLPLAPRPGVIPLRALMISDIFEGSMRTIRGNPAATLGLSFVVTLVFMLPTVATAIVLTQFDPGTDVARAALQYFSTDGSTLLQSLATVVLSGMLVLVVSEAVLGRRMSIGAAWSTVVGRLWALIGVSLLTILMILAPMLVAVIPAVVGLLATGSERWLALLVLLIPTVPLTIFLWVKLRFAVAVTTLERLGPITSIKRSWALTRHQWWRIFGIELLTAFLISIVSGILLMPTALISVNSALTDPSPEALGLLSLLLIQAAALIATTLTSPFGAGVTSLLYIDQRIRKEALDVSLMAAATEPGAP